MPEQGARTPAGMDTVVISGITLVAIVVVVPVVVWLTRSQQVEGGLEATAEVGTGHGSEATDRAATDRPADADADAESARPVVGDADPGDPTTPAA